MTINAGVGNTAAGSIVQLVARGAMDKYLTDNASRTFWKSKYEKTTQFAMESIMQSFSSQVQFGATSQITLNRTGDLVYYMYVVLELPGIKAVDMMPNNSAGGGAWPGAMQMPRSQFPNGTGGAVRKADANVFAEYCNEHDLSGVAEDASASSAQINDALVKGKARWLAEKYSSGYVPESTDGMDDEPQSELWASWSNAIGQHLIKCASIVIGGSTVDTLYSDFLYMWEELTGKSGKRLTEMIGKRFSRQQLVNDSAGARLLFVPLPWWFTASSGQALSLASLQFHGVQIQVEFERLENCITVSDEARCGVVDVATNQPLTQSSLAAALDTTYVYLDTVERQKFSTTHYEQLITQLQSYTISSQNSQVRLSLNFNHPVIELIWAVRRQVNERCNNYFNYSGIDGRDPIVRASLHLNSQPRFNNRPGSWLRLVQPYQCHTNIPESYVYCYSFALHPESCTPSGSVNLSRIDHCDLILNLQEGLGKEQVTVMVYARSWNVLRFREGLAGVAYANFGMGCDSAKVGWD
jgi:hypothetical protein